MKIVTKRELRITVRKMMNKILNISVLLICFSWTNSYGQSSEPSFCGQTSGTISNTFFENCDSLTINGEVKILTGAVSILNNGSWNEPIRFFGSKINNSLKSKIANLTSGDKVEFMIKCRLTGGVAYAYKLTFKIE